MKLISSIVRCDKLDAVREALSKLDVCGVTVADVHNHSPQKHETLVWRGRERSLGFSLKHEVTVVVHDDDVDAVVETIIRTARTGLVGDGHVSVMSLDHRYSIRTGEREIS